MDQLNLDPIPLETVQERFSRRQLVGTWRPGMPVPSTPLGEDDPHRVPYTISEGVWRPDGKGANQTIFSPFEWKGRKTRALKPVPKFRRGEQWLRPQQEDNDEMIGLMTGDSRLVGNTALTSKFSGYGVGEAIPGSSNGEGQPLKREYPLRYNVFMNQELFSKNTDTGGVVGDTIYGVDEASLERNARRDEVLGILSQDHANVSIGKPMPFLKMNVDNQTAGQLEEYVSDARTAEFLLDPVANFQYNDVAMAATPGTIYVNTSGDPNTAGGDNMGADREWQSFSDTMNQWANKQGPRAGASFSTTLNAVKINSTAQRTVNTWGDADSRTVEGFETSDQLAPDANISAKNQHWTTKNLFGRNTRAPDLGRADSSLDQDKRIVTQSRRLRRKEQNQGMMQPSFASSDQDKRDSSIVTMSRRYRRKEQNQGMMQPSFAGPDQDKRDSAIITMSRRYRRKELNVASGSRTGSDFNVHADTQNRDPINRRKDADTMLPLTAALYPDATVAGGDVVGREFPILAENPEQARKGVDRQLATSGFGTGNLTSTETEQYYVQSRVDPNAQNILQRTTQQVNLRDRSTAQGAIGVINLEEADNVRAAYQRDFVWSVPRAGKLGQPAMYQSEDENNMSDGDEL